MLVESTKAPKSTTRTYAVAPRLVARPDAAHYVGVKPTLFDGLVREGVLPLPKELHARRLWDLHELDKAIEDLPVSQQGTTIAMPLGPYDDVA